MKKFRGRACVALGSWLLTTPAFGDVGAEMEAEGDVGSEMSADAEGKTEGEGEARASGETSGATAAPAGPALSGGEFASATGHTGAGLSLSPAQKGRAWGEIGLSSNSSTFALSPVLGGGYKVADNVELEVVVPLTYASFDLFLNSDSSFNFGNIYVGANVLGGSGKLKYKFGGGLGLPTSNAADFADGWAYYSAAAMRGFQDYYLWAAEMLTMNGLGRIEYGDKVVFTGDAALSVYFPIGDASNDNAFSLALAPGVGAWLGDSALVGGRLLIWWGSNDSSPLDDHAQIGIEPYFRYQLGESAFLNARFTLNVDEPAGFSFDDDPFRFWGFHLGGGFTF